MTRIAVTIYEAQGVLTSSLEVPEDKDMSFAERVKTIEINDSVKSLLESPLEKVRNEWKDYLLNKY